MATAFSPADILEPCPISIWLLSLTSSWDELCCKLVRKFVFNFTLISRKEITEHTQLSQT